MNGLNERAWKLVRHLVADAESLGVVVHQLHPGGATVIDAGIEAPGSLEAGRLFAEICLGGLGQVNFDLRDLDGWGLPSVTVSTNRPVIACIASQYAGWAIEGESFFAMGSGPARALYAAEPLFKELGYREQAAVAVLALEGRTLPTAPVAEQIASACGVAPDGLYLVIAPTASLAGSVQVAARVVETGLYKMYQVGFDLQTVVSGLGTCPLAPIAAGDLQAMGRTNDAVLYGGRAWFGVRTGDAEIEAVIEKLPAEASPDYGTPFCTLLDRYGGNFYLVDPLLFAPAEITLNNFSTGRTFHAGRVNGELLRKSFFG